MIHSKTPLRTIINSLCTNLMLFTSPITCLILMLLITTLTIGQVCPASYLFAQIDFNPLSLTRPASDTCKWLSSLPLDATGKFAAPPLLTGVREGCSSSSSHLSTSVTFTTFGDLLVLLSRSGAKLTVEGVLYKIVILAMHLEMQIVPVCCKYLIQKFAACLIMDCCLLHCLGGLFFAPLLTVSFILESTATRHTESALIDT